MSKLSTYPLATSIAITDAVPITSGYGSSPATDNAQISLLLSDPGVQVFNIKAFGAKVDGSTDDTTAITNAVNAAHTAGGGVILFPYGTCIVSSAITLYSFITIRGLGRAVSAIKLKNASNSDIFIANTAGGYESIIIEDLAVDGNAANQTGAGTGSALIYITGSDTLLRNIAIRNCTVQNSYEHAIFLTGDNTSNRYPKWITGNYIFNHGPTSVGFGIYTDYCPNTEVGWNTLKKSNGNDAIEMGHIGEIRCHNNYLVDGKIQFPFGDNSVISNNILDADTIQNDANTANNVVIIGNQVNNVTPTPGFGGISVTGSNPTITGNYVKVTTQAGIRVYGSTGGGVVSNNFIDGTSASTGGSNGVYTDHSNNMVISGNFIQNFANAVQVTYDNNMVANNKVVSCTTGVYLSNTSGTGHVIVGCQILNNDLNGATTPFDPQNQTSYYYSGFDSNGLQIGYASSHKIGLYGATPVVQPSTTGTTTGFTVGAGTTVNSASTFTGAVGSTAYTIGDVVLALKQIGILVS